MADRDFYRFIESDGNHRLRTYGVDSIKQGNNI